MNSKEHYIETIFTNLQGLRREFAPRNVGGNGCGAIGLSQANVLFMLKDNRSVSNTAIAERLSISPSAATQLVDALEEQGFVMREADENDRRVTVVRCTEKGNLYLAELRKKRFKQLQDIFSVLDQSELEQLVAITAKLSQKIKQRNIA
jgi:DNA-binding MarR family transcriptional regulator